MKIRSLRWFMVMGFLMLVVVSATVGLAAANTVTPSGASDVTVTLSFVPTMAVATMTP